MLLRQESLWFFIFDHRCFEGTEIFPPNPKRVSLSTAPTPLFFLSLSETLIFLQFQIIYTITNSLRLTKLPIRDFALLIPFYSVFS
ncbi:hypothetical protein Hanom_Chr04g00369061 [Helianthus anomalus]